MSDTEGPSRREAIEAAMNANEEAETSTPVEASPTPGPVEAAPEATVAAAEESPKPDSESKGRDGKGRFQRGERAIKPTARPAQKLEASVAPAPTKPGVAAAPVATGTPAATPPAELKAPQSWKAGTREKWGALPPEVQQEVYRREKETAAALQQASQARELHSAFTQTVQPYLGMIQAEGGQPMAAIGNLLQTAAALRTAPAGHKAQLIANMVRTFGVPIEALDAALSGQPMPQGQGHQQAVDPNAIARQVMQQVTQGLQTQRQQATQQRYVTQMQDFASKHEFYDDVREYMADLLEVAGRRGIELTPEDAYNRSCEMHPEISKVHAQRKAVQQANATVASTQRARAASSSIRSQPSGAVSAPQPAGRRAALEAAFEQHNNR